jgi:hypothetical protein
VEKAISITSRMTRMRRRFCLQTLACLVLFLQIAGLFVVESPAQETNVLLRQSIDGMRTENGEPPIDQVDASGSAIGQNSTIEAPSGLISPDTGNTGLPDNIGQPQDLTTRRAAAPPPQTTGSIVSNASHSNTNVKEPKILPQGVVATLDENGQLDARRNVATSPLEAGTPVVDSDPYDASGIRLGVFDLFPTLEQNIGYTSNATSTQNGKGAWFSETKAGLRLQSNWSRHAFEAELGASYQRFFKNESDALPTANDNGMLRLDFFRDHTLTLRGGYDFATESASSSNLAVGGGLSVVDRPGVHGLSSSAELANTDGNLRYLLRGSLAKTIYEDATLSDGSKLYQGDRDNLLASVTGRLSYQISPAVSPFVEGSAGRRLYRVKVDSNGNRRDSVLYSMRGGVDLDFGEKLKGQLSAGYIQENFKDANISTLGALTFDGSLTWSPVRLTSVTATLSTNLSPSANANDNGSVLYSLNVGISRKVRANLTLDANLAASLQDYDTTGRRDITLGVDAGYTYWFNRFIAATGRASYQKIDSTNSGSSYEVGTIRFGLKFQR